MKGVSRNVRLSRLFDLAVEKNILVVGVHEGVWCGCLGEEGLAQSEARKGSASVNPSI
jgi:hypothetical protein